MRPGSTNVTTDNVFLLTLCVITTPIVEMERTKHTVVSIIYTLKVLALCFNRQFMNITTESWSINAEPVQFTQLNKEI